MELAVKAPLNKTESSDKLLRAVENLFPSLEFKEKGGFLQSKGSDRNDLAAFKELLKLQQIQDTAKAFLNGSIDGERMIFELNKQAAYMGKVNFVDFPIALGTIIVEIKDRDPEALIDWLTLKDS